MIPDSAASVDDTLLQQASVKFRENVKKKKHRFCMVGVRKFWRQIPISVSTLVVNTNEQYAQDG